MAKVMVESYDVLNVLSLLNVYMGQEEPAGHFKDPDRRLPDARYFVSIGKLKAAMTAAGVKDN